MNENVCNSKQKRNDNECLCECKELGDMGSCENDILWNSSTYYCECNKTCKSDEYLDIKNCSCK